jgi:predicted permease
MSTIELIGRFIPIFLLFGLGYLFRRTGFLSLKTASEMKKLVANIALPALLVQAFASLSLGPDEFRMIIFMFGLCLAIFLMTQFLFRLAGHRGDIRGYMMSGFEAGMLGYGLFLTVFGTTALPVFASVDLGQMLFVLVVLISSLLGRFSKEENSFRGIAQNVSRNIVTSPFVWAIVAGLVFGWIGNTFQIPSAPLAPVVSFLNILGNLTMPVIALVIGFELDFSRRVVGRALVFVAVRKIVMSALVVLLIRFLPIEGPLIRYAFAAILLLPPPFVVTLIAPEDEQGLISGILSISTVISIPAFALAILIMGGI